MTNPTLSLSSKVVERLLVQRYTRFEGGWQRAVDLGDVLREAVVGWLDAHDLPALRSLLACTVAIRRLDVEGPYPLHSWTPHPRGRSWNPVVAEVRRGRQSLWLAFDRDRDAVAIIGLTEHDREVAGTRLLVLFNPGGLPRLYGSFGYVLSLLETGHLIEQASLWADARSAHRRSSSGSSARSLPSGLRHVPVLAAFEFDDADPLPHLTFPAAMIAATADSDDGLGEAAPELRDVLRQIAAEPSETAWHEPVPRSPEDAAGRLARSGDRSSAQTFDLPTFLGQVLEPSDVRWLEDESRLALLHAAVAGLSIDLLVHTARGHWLRTRVDREGAHAGGDDIGSHPDIDPRRLVVGDGQYLLGCSWIAVIRAERGRDFADGRDFAEALLGAGSIAQSLSIAAVSLGHAAIPLRSLDEVGAVEMLSGTDLPLYLLACGVPSMQATAFDVGGAG